MENRTGRTFPDGSAAPGPFAFVTGALTTQCGQRNPVITANRRDCANRIRLQGLKHRRLESRAILANCGLCAAPAVEGVRRPAMQGHSPRCPAVPRHFAILEELADALEQFRQRNNEQWLVQRLHFQPPQQAHQALLALESDERRYSGNCPGNRERYSPISGNRGTVLAHLRHTRGPLLPAGHP